MFLLASNCDYGFYRPERYFMHFPHASVFLISFGFQHYWFVLWRWGGAAGGNVDRGGKVNITSRVWYGVWHYLPGMVWCMVGGGALNEGLEWRAMNAGGHEPVGPEFDPRWYQRLRQFLSSKISQRFELGPLRLWGDHWTTVLWWLAYIGKKWVDLHVDLFG